MSEIFEECLVKLHNALINVDITVKNVMVVVKFAMEIVEVTELKGEEQKELAVKLVRQVIVNAPISDDEEKLCLDMVDNGVMGNMMDLISDASKGNININTAKKLAGGCCSAIWK